MNDVALNLGVLVPELFLAAATMLLMVVGVMSRRVITSTLMYAGIFVLGFTFFLLLGVNWFGGSAVGGFFMMDSFAGLIKIMILVAMGGVLALSVGYMKREFITQFEYPILVLFATLGMMMMVSANDLMSLYIGLELQSLSLYVLASIRRNSLRSAEAGLKYFVLGALSSGMVLFGSSLIYGFAATTNFQEIATALETAPEIKLGLSMGLVFLIAGLAFKISAVPFHMWTPDVYEGAPTSVTALFAIVPKMAAMALFIRLFAVPFAGLQDIWSPVLWGLAMASMTVGALGGLAQTNLKRLLAYSSIGNMGYALIGLVIGGADGIGATLYYMVIYMVMSAATFGIILSLRREGSGLEKIEHLEGLSKTHPVPAYILALLMFSMSGIPPLAGFFGKLFIFQIAIDSGFFYLAILGVMTSVIAAFYYLRIIKVMFFDEPVETMQRDSNMGCDVVVIVSMAVVIGLILNPEPLLTLVQQVNFGAF